MTKHESMPSASSDKDSINKVRMWVLHDLMVLPAFRLQNSQIETLEELEYSRIATSINDISINNLYFKSKDFIKDNKSIDDNYQKPNLWKRVIYSFKSLPNKGKILGYCAIISLAIASLIRFIIKSDNPESKIVVALAFLIFSFSCLGFGLQLAVSQSNVSSIFHSINRNLENISQYTDFLDITSNPEALQNKSDRITISIIEDEISSLYHHYKRLNLIHIIIAFLISFVVIYVSGDVVIILIKDIAELLGFESFSVIKNLNRENFALYILFPTGIAWSKDMAASGLQQRNKLLRQSLVILQDRIKDRKSSLQEDRSSHRQIERP